MSQAQEKGTQLSSCQQKLWIFWKTTCSCIHADAKNHPPTPHSVLPEKPPGPVSMFSAFTAAHKHADGENYPPTPYSVLEVAARDCGITTVSTSTLENMWKKAVQLVQSSSGILKVPWSSDEKARLVMSSSSEHPTSSRQRVQIACSTFVMKSVPYLKVSLCVHTSLLHAMTTVIYVPSSRNTPKPNVDEIWQL